MPEWVKNLLKGGFQLNILVDSITNDNPLPKGFNHEDKKNLEIAAAVGTSNQNGIQPWWINIYLL